jgi:hypothetical protein
MTQTKPRWFTPTAAAVLIRTDAEQESIAARAMALRIDHANLHCWREGSVPDALRSEYPRGYGPGQLLRGPERALVAAFVDAAAT